MTGKLIAIEGIDGTGKTSLCFRLQEELPREDFIFTHEPTNSSIGKVIREYLLNRNDDELQLLYLFAADHRYHIENIVKPCLEQGLHVISDRYLHSHIAYQLVALKEYEKTHGRASITDVDSLVQMIYSGWLRYPDVTLMLLIHSEVALTRISGRDTARSTYEQLTMLDMIQDAYIKQAFPYYPAGKTHYLPVEQELEELVQQVKAIILRETLPCGKNL